ncbi:hypothetical protein IMSAG185_01843 [Lachnospiraceae bacterium]|nr:hypothetical protein IMSAG185_01843 [Lachnospiraceae bacterium]
MVRVLVFRASVSCCPGEAVEEQEGQSASVISVTKEE